MSKEIKQPIGLRFDRQEITRREFFYYVATRCGGPLLGTIAVGAGIGKGINIHDKVREELRSEGIKPSEEEILKRGETTEKWRQETKTAGNLVLGGLALFPTGIL